MHRGIRSVVLVVLVALGGCGRIGFDATPDATPTVPAGPSCDGVAATCGPQMSGSCCTNTLVPGGRFYRGYDVAADGLYKDESYPATVSDFWLDDYEVTLGRFRQFVAAGMGTQLAPPAACAGAHPRLPGSGWDPAWNTSLLADTPALVAALQCDAGLEVWTDMPAGNENRPMNCISWFEAMAFCIWDGGYLPTETQWNFAAAGGGEQRALPWSNPPSDVPLDVTAYASYWFDETSGCLGDGAAGCAVTDLVPVGTKPAGNGRWGHADLAGNVWEWSLDYGVDTFVNPCVDCAQLVEGATNHRVSRGGGFFTDRTNLRTALRGDSHPTVRYLNIGARCARGGP